MNYSQTSTILIFVSDKKKSNHVGYFGNYKNGKQIK